MKTNALILTFAAQVLLLAGCSKRARVAIDLENMTNAQDARTISNILVSQKWPIFKKAESGKFGKITIPLASGTNSDARHYDVSWNGSKWRVSPTTNNVPTN